MAPRKMQQHQQQPGLEPKMKNKVKKVRQLQVKAGMGKTKEGQKCIEQKQREVRKRFGEIERQCNELKKETEMIVKQTASTHIKLLLMFKILKARESGRLSQAAHLTNLLREFVAKEKSK